MKKKKKVEEEEMKKQKNNKKKRSRGGEGRGHCLPACHWLLFVKAAISLTHDSLVFPLYD
jgi:hypothetical protein